jgi:hypothetical protein
MIVEMDSGGVLPFIFGFFPNGTDMFTIIGRVMPRELARLLGEAHLRLTWVNGWTIVNIQPVTGAVALQPSPQRKSGSHKARCLVALQPRRASPNWGIAPLAHCQL